MSQATPDMPLLAWANGQAEEPEEERRLADMWDADIAPHYTAHQHELLLRDLRLPPRAQILIAGCSTGAIIPDLLRTMETTDQGRIIALESSGPMLKKARARVADCDPRRVFLRGESLQTLRFADGVFDVVVSNLAWLNLAEPGAALREFRRVLAPQGRLALGFPTQGTLEEIHDFFAEVTLKYELQGVQRKLDALRTRRYPATHEVRAVLEALGFAEVTIEQEEYEISFPSGRALLEAPLIRTIFAPLWREAAGVHAETLLARTRETIDTYYGGAPCTVRMVAAVARALKLGTLA